MENNGIDLLTLQNMLKQSVEGCFSSRVWVKAEISEIKRASSGHCYLTLSQSKGGSVVAKAEAAIWASRYIWIENSFRAVTGSTMTVGMEILAYVRVSYHLLHGLTLSIEDIDANFTLGVRERLKRETIKRLEEQGFMELQKELCLPDLPYSLAVISSSTAAGYQDFYNHLIHNAYGFVFDVQLIEATMQGETAPASIISALNVAAAWRFDAVLILRGGGSELDLSCFDDYNLAVAIATCPVPVFTAIGHDKDFHVADMVACGYVKTPTALADLFLSFYIAVDQRLTDLESRISSAFGNRLTAMESKLNSFESRIFEKFKQRLKDASQQLEDLKSRIFGKFGQRMTEDLHLLEKLEMKIPAAFNKRLTDDTHRLEMLEPRIFSAFGNRLTDDEHRLEKLEMRIKSADPRAILKRGYVLALNGRGTKMKSARDVSVGEGIQVMFSDGVVHADVTEVKEGVDDAGDILRQTEE